jgi:hypothetical protein
MAVRKFSEIAASGASFVSGDSILAVQSGTTDVLFSKTQFFDPLTLVQGSGSAAVPSLQIGSGSATSAGWILGYYGSSGYAGIWNTAVSPSGSNYSVAANSVDTLVNAISGVVYIRKGNSSIATFDTDRMALGSSGDAILRRAAAATLHQGLADAATATAQTLQVQSVVAGTSNTAGADWTIQGSRGTGTGAGGSIIFKTAAAGGSGSSQNSAAEALRIGPTGAVTTTNLGVTITGSSNSVTLSNTNFGTFHFEQGTAPGSAGVIIFPSAGQFISVAGGAFCFTGTSNPSGTVDLYLSRGAAATFQQGAADAASPVAQTTQVQSVVAGTSNTAGVDWTLQGSRGTGTGAGGAIIIKTAPVGGSGSSQNAAAEVARFLAAGNVRFTNAANFSANGSVATTLGSVGPAGSNTTVQKWLTFVDDGGTTRYVPCF